MQVGAPTSATNSGGANGTAQNGPKILGKDDFFKLLIAELRCQDPLEPMKDRDFIAQMANFSSLEQAKNLNTMFEGLNQMIETALLPMLMLQQAGGFLGMEVDYLKEDTTCRGTVEAVSFEKGVPVLVVNGEKISVGSVTELRIPGLRRDEDTGTGGN